MYPLSATLVGCRDAVQQSVKNLLADQKVTVDESFSDVEAAVRGLQDSVQTVWLTILYVPNAASVAQLKQFTAQFVGQPVIALVDGKDPALLLGAMRAGAAQVVPLPLVADDFRAAMDCIAQQFGHAALMNQTVAVSGVTGGCGATTLAVNLAHELASQHGRSVILSELSLQIGKLAAYLDVNPTQTTFDLLAAADRLDVASVQKALSRVSDRFDILVGEYRQITPVSVTVDNVLRLIDTCRSLANFAIFDVPCTYDDLYFETLAAADQIVLVGEQKIPSIRTLKLVCEALDRIEGLRKLHIVINRYDPRMPGFGAERLKNLLGKAEILTISNDYASVMASINHGRPLRQESPRSPALADMGDVVRTLLNLEEEHGQESVAATPPIFGRLIRRFGLAN